MGARSTYHRELGPGFREVIYARAFGLELQSCGLRFEAEKPIAVRFKQWEIPGQKVDLVVEDLVLVEIKSVSRLKQIHQAQVMSYLKTMRLHIGLLLNFNELTMKAGTRRVVLSETNGAGKDRCQSP